MQKTLRIQFCRRFAMNFPPWLFEGALMTKGDFTKVTFKNGIMTKAGMLVACMIVFANLGKARFLVLGSHVWEMGRHHQSINSCPLYFTFVPIWRGQAQPYWMVSMFSQSCRYRQNMKVKSIPYHFFENTNPLAHPLDPMMVPSFSIHTRVCVYIYIYIHMILYDIPIQLLSYYYIVYISAIWLVISILFTSWFLRLSMA